MPTTGSSPSKTYEILEQGRAIRCLRCGLVSWNVHDIDNRYCGHCHVFHE
jgi:ribosomal protein L37E